jgi:hypothetical protein
MLRQALARVGGRVQTIVLPGHRHATEYASSASSPTIAFLRRFDNVKDRLVERVETGAGAERPARDLLDWGRRGYSLGESRVSLLE